MQCKRLLTIGILGLAFAVGGVSAQENNSDGITIGVSIPAATHGWTGGINYHARQAIDRLEKLHDNIDYVLVTAGGPSEQVSDLEDMTATRDIDALVILPFESDPLTGPVQRVAEQGTFVTVVDRGLARDDIADLYVAGDNSAFGRVAGEYMVKKLDGEGKIVVLRGIPTEIDNQRVEAFQKAIEDSDIEVLDMQYADWSQDKGFTIMQDYLQRFDDIDAVWAQDDDTAQGVLGAIKQAGREDEMWVLGGAGMKQMVKRVMEGDRMVPADVLYPATMIATAIDITTLHYVSNGAVRGEYIFDSPLITQDNAEQFYFPDSPY